MPELDDQLRRWADAAPPVTAAEARARARAEGRPASGAGRPHGAPPRGRVLALVAAAVVAVGLVAAVAFTRPDDDGSDRVTNDPPAPTTAPAPTTPDTPPDTAPATPTSLPMTDPQAPVQPETWVGITDDFRLVVVDTATGDEVRELHAFDDPNDFGEGGEPVAAGSFGGTVVRSPDGQTVYYDTCCEPAPGIVYRVPIGGGEPEQVTVGSYPALSPDGTKLAVAELSTLKVIDLATGEETSYRSADGGEAVVGLLNPSWSSDGTAVVYERYATDFETGTLQVQDLDGEGRVTQLAEADEQGTPTLPRFLADGRVTYVRQGRSNGSVVGPSEDLTVAADGTAGDDQQVTRPDPVNAQAFDPSGSFLVRVLGSGTVESVGDDSADPSALGQGFLAAAW